MRLDTLTLALLASTALLSAAAVSLALGSGQSVDWLPAGPPREVAPAEALQPTQPLPPQALALTWQQSMFSPDRKPDLATGKAQASSLDGISLSGVIIDGQAQWVLLRMPDKRHLKLAVGSSLDNGWTLTGATPQQATFTHQGQTRELRLPLLRLPPPSKTPLITLPDVPTP
ncbi:general secretion pathway protein GspN [Pseudomonas sp. 3A(2025)]